MAEPAKIWTSRKRAWLFVAIGGVFIAYAVAWRIGANQMENTARQWIDDQRAMGLEVSHNTMSSTGFPLKLRLQIDQPVISAPGAWRWQADQLFVDLAPYDLTRVTFSPLGAHEIFANGYGEWRANTGTIKATLSANRKTGWLLSAFISDGRAEPISGAGFSIERLDLVLSPAADDQTALNLALAIAGLDIREVETELNIEHFQTDLSLTKTDMLSGPEAAAQWRAAGGALIIHSLEAEAEATRLSLSGALTVDGADYPTGRLETEIFNPAGLSNWLGEAGVISASESETTAATLSLMAIAGGGKIAAPLELGNGVAEIAGVKLADLPRLE